VRVRHGATERRCNVCRRWKLIDSFGRRGGSECLSCHKSNEKARPKNTALIRERSTQYRRDPKNREKIKARQKLNNAIRDGWVEREPCENCGEPKTDGHHEDYSKPYDVRWLCRPCHKAEHAQEAAA